MIARTIPRWQVELADALSRPADLLARLDLPATSAVGDGAGFPMRAPAAYVSRMARGDPADPLLRQVLPSAKEAERLDGFSTDPVGDLATLSAPGVLRKYRGRALIIVTGACPIHCRYCFRRHFPYATTQISRERWSAVISHLGADASLREVILSGGDPLSLTDERLAQLVTDIDRLAHLRRLRVHTRMPIVLPARVDDSLLAWVGATRLSVVFVLHCNHPQEIDSETAEAIERLARARVTLLNQAVLLRGVNDDPGVLAALSERLFEVGVLPYYLHQLDRVAGAGHFEVDDERAVALVRELRAWLPGYLVPRLVREERGQPSKTPLL
jgi:EF-P beta-lysylation protein EpmB